ncbi:MAG: hypothetical protein K0R52_491 [Alphaproteobacteria bacterium]|jgi:hypothetical protein|nr:hypothetical protein [Alphaproteobacteria bacterium]
MKYNVFPKMISLPWALAFLGFFLHLALFWPGLLSADSYSQLQQAQAGVFTNHHPALMSWVWSHFLQWVPGPGLMLGLHLLFFWGAIGLFASTLFRHHSRAWWWFYLIPLWPVFLCYSSMIWKDVGFSFSFLAAISILFHCSFNHKKPTLLQECLTYMLLLYGVGVKYQALYLLPFCAFWFASLFDKHRFSKKTLFLSVGMIISMMGTTHIIDKILVPSHQQSHSWQMARLYDLAGISVRAHQPLFPAYITEWPYFSMARLEKLYSPQNIDALMYDEHPTLTSTQKPEDLSKLWGAWKRAVITHPVFYIQHRFSIWLKLINKNINDYYYYLDNESKALAFAFFTVPFLKAYLIVFPSLFMRFYWVFIIFFLVIKRSRQKSLPLEMKFSYQMMVALSFMQLGVYFFLSMASDLRYILLSNLLAFFLIPLLDVSKRKQEQNLAYLSTLSDIFDRVPSKIVKGGHVDA